MSFIVESGPREIFGPFKVGRRRGKMTGRWSDEESRRGMETMEKIRSSLFCSYIWLSISPTLTLTHTVETSSV